MAEEAAKAERAATRIAARKAATEAAASVTASGEPDALASVPDAEVEAIGDAD